MSFDRIFTTMSADLHNLAAEADATHPDNLIQAIKYLRDNWPGLTLAFSHALLHGVSELRKDREKKEKALSARLDGYRRASMGA